MLEFSTETARSQWFLQDAETNGFLFNVHFVNTDSGWIAYRDTILATSNGGSSWLQIPIGLAVTLTDIFFVDSRVGWASGGNTTNGFAAIIKSTDGGASWIDVSPPLDYFIDDLFFDSHDVGWGFGQEGCCTGKIVKTTDGGFSWNEQPLPIVGYLSSGFFVDSMVGWATGFQTILATTDGGNTWIEQDTVYTHSSGIPLSSVYFVNRDTGWVVGGIGWVSVIAKTTDGGKTWSHRVFEPPSPEMDVGRLSGVQFSNDSTGWAVGRVYPGVNELILKTTDGGTTWFRQDDNLGCQLFSVYFVDEHHGWSTGECGTILGTTNGGTTFVEEDDVLPTQHVLFQNFPNPFNLSTSIKYNLPIDTKLSLKVYDVLGREVLCLVDGVKKAGYHQVTLDASDLASGTYFYKVQAGLFSDVRKLLLVR